MKEAYVYLGHLIDLNLTSRQAHWRYTYFIDTHYCFEGTTDSPDADAARTNALERAHNAIAQLDAMAPPAPKRVAVSPSMERCRHDPLSRGSSGRVP